MAEAIARPKDRLRTARWASPFLASAGAALFLYAASRPLVESSLVRGARLMPLLPAFNVRHLTYALPLFVVFACLAASIRMMIAPPGGVARGVILAAGVGGIALILNEAGLIMAVKHGFPGPGAVLGAFGSLLMLAGGLLAAGEGTPQTSTLGVHLAEPFSWAPQHFCWAPRDGRLPW